MKINDNISKNTVKAENQIDEKCKVVEVENPALRVLFMGNSITLHEPAPAIGWNARWGMAASAQENDYVHLVLKALREKYGEVSYCITNVADFEREYWKDENISRYAVANDFSADTVIYRFGENTNRDMLKEKPMKEHLNAFLEHFAKNAKKVVVTDLFWQHEYLCSLFEELADECGYEFVSLCDLGDDDENKAIGLFAHEGVALHPGDLGMKRIAERIIKKLV